MMLKHSFHYSFLYFFQHRLLLRDHNISFPKILLFILKSGNLSYTKMYKMQCFWNVHETIDALPISKYVNGFCFLLMHSKSCLSLGLQPKRYKSSINFTQSTAIYLHIFSVFIFFKIFSKFLLLLKLLPNFKQCLI